MTFSNFQIHRTIFKYGVIWEEYGTVDITTGLWKWKKTITHKIFKTDNNWMFLDTGRYTPGGTVERLERAYKAQRVEADD